jgi:hypothetical protein
MTPKNKPYSAYLANTYNDMIYLLSAIRLTPGGSSPSTDPLSLPHEKPFMREGIL